MINVIKTTLLLSILTSIFLVVGYWLGGQNGMILALVFAAISNFGMYWFSGSMVLKMQGAKPLDDVKYNSIVRMVQDLASKDGLPMPKLYFVDTPIPNAFATGRSKHHAVVAVTRGITELLTDNELKAVLAHELGHIKNNDMLVSTIAATLGGAISTIAQLAMFFGGNDEESPNPIAMIAMMIVAPLAAAMIQMAVSRSREFGADSHGAGLMGTGKELAAALEKLELFKPALKKYQPTPNQEATNHLMFTNLFNMQGLSALFSTHPSTKARVARLHRNHIYERAK
ncbi:protease HtpX [Candidatus Saccharibacteria bacterium]|nr:protease HtpX [Candidatus Saccharibacteria bacterium]